MVIFKCDICEQVIRLFNAGEHTGIGTPIFRLSQLRTTDTAGSLQQEQVDRHVCFKCYDTMMEHMIKLKSKNAKRNERH